MPSYATLDAIADAYNPLLAGLALLLMLISLLNAQWQQAAMRLAGFAVVAAVAYGGMLLDRHLSIWPAFGLDYSTHTASALGLVILLSYIAHRLMPLWIGSLVGYLLLMLYQRYHTLADIVTTAAVVGVPLGVGLAWLYRPGSARGTLR